MTTWQASFLPKIVCAVCRCDKQRVGSGSVLFLTTSRIFDALTATVGRNHSTKEDGGLLAGSQCAA